MPVAGEWPDVHVITGAVKMWFRELPDPVIPFASFNEFARITAGTSTDPFLQV